MSNPEGSLRRVDLRFGVPNDASDEDVQAFSRAVADYWLEGVVLDPKKDLLRIGTAVELFLSASNRRVLVPKEELTQDERELREDMEFVLHDIEFLEE